jgi:hypothetical protein
MVPFLHPRLPEAARAVRLSRMMELTGTEKTAEEKLAIDQDIFNFARSFAPDAEGLEKTATGLVRLGASLCSFEKKASISDDAAEKLATVGVIEDTLGSVETKLAREARMLNRGYGVAVLCDLLKV